ncbi:MAG: asparagine synthase-related protein [Steroidobacteraceae bacterium]
MNVLSGVHGKGDGPGQSLDAVTDGGAIIGRARSDGIELAYIGVITRPLDGWPQAASPIDDPDATARFLLGRFLESGKTFLDRVHGQFALVVADRHRGTTLLATDPYGGRSWFVSEEGGNVAFSSNLHALAKSRGRNLQVDRSFEDFFLIHGFYPFGRTPFSGIRALPAGSLSEWPSSDPSSRSSLSATDPWNRSGENAPALSTEAQVIAELHASILRATIELLPSRPQRVAVLLGGFDSALVAALIHRSGFEVETFSFHYGDAEFNQPHTDTLARHLGIRHHWVEIDRSLIEDGLRTFAQTFNQPTNWPNYVIQTAHVCRQIRAAGISHCYTGDGCDSVFLGYPGTYQRARLFDALPELPVWVGRTLVGMAARPALERHFGHPYRVALSMLRGLGRRMPARGYLSFRILDEVSLRQLRTDSPPAMAKDTEALISELSAPFAGLPPLRLAYLGKAAVSPNRNKMIGSADSSGITIQSPYLHAGLKNFAVRLPEELMRPKDRTRSRVTGKYVLMKMAEEKGLLPPSIIYQRKMAAVDAPIDEWYAGPMRPLLLDMMRGLPFSIDVSYANRLLDRKFSEQLFKRHVMVDKVISHAASLLATYAAFTGIARE